MNQINSSQTNPGSQASLQPLAGSIPDITDWVENPVVADQAADWRRYRAAVLRCKWIVVLATMSALRELDAQDEHVFDVAAGLASAG